MTVFTRKAGMEENKKIMAVDNKVIYLILAVFGFFILAVGGMIPGYKLGGSSQTIINQPAGGGGLPDGGTLKTCDMSQRATLSMKAVDPFNGSAIIANAEAWDTNANPPVQTGTETNLAATLTSISTTAPMYFKGYVMVGNDNFESGTDRGAEYFYKKVPISDIGCSGAPPLPVPTVSLEGTPTWSGYDDGTLEATTNITVGSGSLVTVAELKIESTTGQYVGNPDFARPLGVCFNVTTAATWEYVKPKVFSSSFKAPGFLSGKNVVGDCYVLDTPAISTGSGKSGIPGEYRVGLLIKAASGQDPAAGAEVIDVIPVDRCWYKDDNSQWVEGFGDESETGTDADCGLASDGSTLKQIWVN